MLVDDILSISCPVVMGMLIFVNITLLHKDGNWGLMISYSDQVEDSKMVDDRVLAVDYESCELHSAA